jgi:propionyl-CoA carboxylase beta chain
VIGDAPAVPVGACRGGAASASLTELNGRPVAWFRLAGGKHSGALGPTEGDVIQQLVRLGLDTGVPIVGELATAGADVHEGLPSLNAWGRVAAVLAEASGAVPVVLAVTGPCVGGPALLLGLADHVVMTTDAFAYVSGPEAVLDFTGQVVERAGLGGAGVQFRRSGLVSLVVPNEEDARWAAADLLSYLPTNFLEDPPVLRTGDEVDRPCRAAADALPSNPQSSYDVREVIADVLDIESFIEVREAHAANVVTGYGRLDGQPVGVIANQPCQLAGTLDIEASAKAAGFVQSCDAFGLPLVTFVDCPGYQPGKDHEWRGMIRYGAQLVHAYGEASVPRLCVVMRKAYGGAFIVMDSKGLGNDLCVAWPTAEIAVMGAAGAVKILHGKRVDGLDDSEAQARLQAELEADYAARFCTPEVAAQRGYIDDVIDPLDTRRVLVAGLAALATKRAAHPHPGRHSNSPL